MINIVLIGFMGSGKSTIAKLLATELAIPYIDSDIYIANNAKSNIADIFALKGEKHFRDLESLFIETFSTKTNHIIATGGGMPIFHDVKKLGLCFYLQSDFDTIAKRIEEDNKHKGHIIRPLFQDKEKALKLYHERTNLYKQSSDYTINAVQDRLGVVRDIVELLRDNGANCNKASYDGANLC